MKSFKTLSDDVGIMGTISNFKPRVNHRQSKKAHRIADKCGKGRCIVDATNGALTATDEVLGHVSRGMTPGGQYCGIEGIAGDAGGGVASSGTETKLVMMSGAAGRALLRRRMAQGKWVFMTPRATPKG